MDFIWNNDTHQYNLLDYGSVENAIKYIDEISNMALSVVIENDDDYKVVEETRGKLNALTKEISTKRKQMTAIVLSSFSPQCMQVEKHAAKIADELTVKMYAYKPRKAKEKTFTLIVKTKDLNTIKKIEKLALKYNCEVESK